MGFIIGFAPWIVYWILVGNMLVAALTLDDAVLERWLQQLSNFGLFAIAAVGVLIGRPFVRDDHRTLAGAGQGRAHREAVHSVLVFLVRTAAAARA